MNITLQEIQTLIACREVVKAELSYYKKCLDLNVSNPQVKANLERRIRRMENALHGKLEVPYV